MAVVRFSETLRNDIIRAGRNLFADKLRELENGIVPETVVERVVVPAMQNIIQFTNQLPDGYVHSFADVTVRVNVGDNSMTRSMYTKDMTHTSKLPWPHNGVELENGINLDSSYRTGIVYLNLEHMPADMREHMAQRLASIDKVNGEAKEFEDSLTKLINHYSTLAPALKEWPALWDLLPAEVQDRHKKIVPRGGKKASAKEELDISLNKMTGAVVRTKLTR